MQYAFEYLIQPVLRHLSIFVTLLKVVVGWEYWPSRAMKLHLRPVDYWVAVARHGIVAGDVVGDGPCCGWSVDYGGH